MQATPPELGKAIDTILDEIRKQRDRERPFLVALDGGSGAGKSTLAKIIAAELGAALIPSDDFYAASISDAEWDTATPAQKVADVIDWRRLRRDALEPLLEGRTARWQPFDFERQQPDGTYPLSLTFVERLPAEVIMLGGAYSSRPELLDLIDLSALVDVPLATRRERLLGRESAEWLEGWHRRWDVSEDYYFTHVRPKSAFDLIVTL